MIPRPPEPSHWAGHPVERFTAAGLTVRAAGRGPLVVLLHGGTGSWNHWVRNVDVLAAQYRVVIPDLPGMGDSPASLPRDTGLDEYLGYLEAAFRDGLVPAGARFLVSGFSYGGLMSACLTRLLADQVRAAALLAPGGFPPGGSQRPPLKGIPPGLSDAEINAINRYNLEMLLIHNPSRIDDATVASQRWNNENSRFNVRHIGYGDHLGNYLPVARCPIMVLTGEFDPLPRPSVAARMDYIRRMNPLIQAEIVPDASHWVCFEQADLVNTKLLDFFAKAPA